MFLDIWVQVIHIICILGNEESNQNFSFLWPKRDTFGDTKVRFCGHRDCSRLAPDDSHGERLGPSVRVFPFFFFEPTHKDPLCVKKLRKILIDPSRFLIFLFRYCRSLFRSIINFIAHKRTICRSLQFNIQTEQLEQIRDQQKQSLSTYKLYKNYKSDINLQQVLDLIMMIKMLPLSDGIWRIAEHWEDSTLQPTWQNTFDLWT